KLAEKQLDLDVSIAPPARQRFRGDPTRLRQILLNLVSNAIKFTERGGLRIDIGLRNERDAAAPAWVRFVVSDTGIGIPPETRGGLFEKFRQADNSITRRYGGSGLGLAICKELVELMGGAIGVEDNSGGGSRFWFEIPLLAAENDMPHTLRSVAPK